MAYERIHLTLTDCLPLCMILILLQILFFFIYLSLMHVHTCANICNLGNIKLLKHVYCYIFTVFYYFTAEVIHCGIVLNVLMSVDLWKKTKQTAMKWKSKTKPYSFYFCKVCILDKSLTKTYKRHKHKHRQIGQSSVKPGWTGDIDHIGSYKPPPHKL